MKIVAAVGFALLFAFGLATVHPVAQSDNEKVFICHVTPSNPEPGEFRDGHVIEVSINAEPAHLKHGDCDRFRREKLGDYCQCFRKR